MFVVEGWKMLREARLAGWLPEAVVLREDVLADNEAGISELPADQLFIWKKPLLIK
ncbi:MAG: hypothetical protein R3B47_12345 [Bacteroidia bacterium]